MHPCLCASDDRDAYSILPKLFAIFFVKILPNYAIISQKSNIFAVENVSCRKVYCTMRRIMYLKIGQRY